MRGEIAVVGIAEVDTFESAGRSPAGLMAEAARVAIADAGLRKQDIDGVFTASSNYYTPSLTFSEYFNLYPRYADATVVGGSSFEAHVGHAAAAIKAGLCDYALVTYGSAQRSDRGRLVSMAEWLPYEQPYGMIHPISPMGMIAQRHFAEYGTTSEDLAAAAVSARAWAAFNPRAPRREPLSIEDVLTSPMLSSPLHKLDCCLVTDGGAALVLCSAERAADLPHEPVYVLGFGEAANHRNISGMPQLTSTRAAESAQRALTMAGLGVSELDTANVYDAFTISLLVLLEDIGFVPKGEAGPWISSGAIAPGGSLALNTNGGGLSYTHPGMLGLFLLTEATQQLRGDAGARQVIGAETALVHGMGLTLGAHGTVVLGSANTL
jgi:acetyl-CoA acetyltransferase